MTDEETAALLMGIVLGIRLTCIIFGRSFAREFWL